MGSGRTKLEDKVSCVLHALGLECESLEAMPKHLRSVVSWTSDMGTEVQLPQFQALDLHSLLPTWLHAKLDSDVADFDAEVQPVAPPVPLEAEHLMPACLIIPGCLHVVHNLSSDLHDKMEWWNAFWEHLQAIANLMADRHHRERFIMTCVRGTPAGVHEQAFQNAGVMRLYEKRWQVVIAVLTHVLPVFDNLRQAWDGDKFSHDLPTSKSLADSVTSALSSSLFCRYIWMIHSVHKLLSNFESWLESCACHEHLLDGVPRKHKRSAQAKFFAKLPSSNCPMRGKRAAELAAGVLEKTLRNMEQLAFQSFLESDAEDAALSPADRAIMLKDLEYAKAYLHFGLTTKLSFWRKLPWRLCALAHHWQTESRAAARACMQEFGESLQQQGLTLRHHHPVSVQFLAADSSLRAALQVHADGGDMSPDLLVAVAQLKFIPCVERVVEGLHRDVKIAAKHVQLGPTKVSLSVRLREIKALCDDDQECLPDLTRHFDDMRHLKKVAALLGVLRHPSILQLLLEKNSDTSEW